MATVLHLPANPNPTPNPTSSLRPPPPAVSGELHFRLCHPCRARARTHLPAAFGRGSPTAAAAERREKDYYATLNIRRDATLQEVKSAYRTLARKYHPDMNNSPGAEEMFKEISAAYEILSDEEKRSLYDSFGEAGLGGDLAPMGLIHMNSSMHSLVVLTSFLEIAWALGDFVLVQKSRTTGDLIFGKQFQPGIKTGKIDSWIAVYTLFSILQP